MPTCKTTLCFLTTCDTRPIARCDCTLGWTKRCRRQQSLRRQTRLCPHGCASAQARCEHGKSVVGSSLPKNTQEQRLPRTTCTPTPVTCVRACRLAFFERFAKREGGMIFKFLSVAPPSRLAHRKAAEKQKVVGLAHQGYHNLSRIPGAVREDGRLQWPRIYCRALRSSKHRPR